MDINRDRGCNRAMDSDVALGNSMDQDDMIVLSGSRGHSDLYGSSSSMTLEYSDGPLWFPRP